MIIFADSGRGILAIPINQILSIESIKEYITIKYIDGYVTSEGGNSKGFEKLDIAYGSQDKAIDKMREFYSACTKNFNAFYF